MTAVEAAMIHEGRPILIGAPDGGVTLLCPARHFYHHVCGRDWAGSIWEDHASDPSWTIRCQGTIPESRS